MASQPTRHVRAPCEAAQGRIGANAAAGVDIETGALVEGIAVEGVELGSPRWPPAVFYDVIIPMACMIRTLNSLQKVEGTPAHSVAA